MQPGAVGTPNDSHPSTPTVRNQLRPGTDSNGCTPGSDASLPRPPKLPLIAR
jgi:hypothetical protein